MVAVNCETRETAALSVAEQFETSESSLLSALQGIDLDGMYERGEVEGHPDEVLWGVLAERLARLPSPATETRWFHLTRVLPHTSFEDGILPLTTSLDWVWNTLRKVFEGTPHLARLRRLEADGVPDFQYGYKVGRPALAGPYAMLVRESAFCAKEMGNHDYLAVPEIVEDICNGYREKFGISIIEEVTDSLVPCIVHFRSDVVRESYSFSAALYLHSTVNRLKMSVHANHCFDGNNHVVPFADILRVEYLKT
jgi:hypothetical protein